MVVSATPKIDENYYYSLVISICALCNPCQTYQIYNACSSSCKLTNHNFYKLKRKCNRISIYFSTDSSSLIKIIASVRPREIYNLAAQSHVKVSFDLSEYTAEVDAVGTLRLLEAIRICGLDNDVKFYQASTSELYGKVVETPQTEKTPFYPRSPYGNYLITFFYFSTMSYAKIFNQLAPNCTDFGSQSTIEKRTTFSHAMASSSITNRRDVVKTL